jgi:acetyl-CoA acetyltransferase
MASTVVIVGAKRSAVGKFQGSLSHLSASEIGGQVLKQCLSELGKDAGNAGGADEGIDAIRNT